MTDREKVIKEAEEAIDILAKAEEPTFWPAIVRLAFEDALNLLKEQEAVEPRIAQDVDGIFATCGNCKGKLWKMMCLEFVVNPDEKPRFCPRCGKAVKWDG